ncbi:MAG TPA: hypothetical protein VL527_12940 [Dongiaceae bacterium]|jgi:hypothetical protein|nr:hypothetical protein [Dongiaceae bacterium]
MKIALLIFLGVIVMAVIAYWLLFPRNTHFLFSRPGGGKVILSRTGISFAAAPDHFATNGMDHLAPYVARLLAPAKSFKFLQLFTPDGTRGFWFDAKDGVVHADFMVKWRREPQREAAIRAFFSSRDTAPAQDYLAGNGGVPDATRVLAYPIGGNPAEVTALTQRILQELCGVAPTEALDIKYTEK